ncbi:hypothetical protein GOV06_04330 [Candidatus Woesearchaeota archaeon]|nr:hypothetical protein [Candidatus Woesearchaeota archaeon]
MDKHSKKLLILVAVIIGLFALSFIFRFVYDPTEAAVTIDELHKKNLEGKESEINYVYNGFSFVYLDNLWYTQVKRNDDSLLDIPLHFGPRDLGDILVTGSVDERFQQPRIYLTFDPTGEVLKFVALSSAELSLNLARGIGLMPVAACYKNETKACESRPIVTCADKNKAVIYFKQTNETGAVKLDGNCVELSGDGWELVKATDRFLLQWYQIME